MKLSRLLLMLLLLAAAYGAGLGQGAQLMVPNVEKAKLIGGINEINKIAESCKKNGGFGLIQESGKIDMFRCIGPIEKKPQSGYRHPEQSGRF